ncbi:MAG TPA: alpha-glucan family phosphorylase, partial [Methylococcaceae bacterium]|nr:alpha-glucan family phosphorylase [Methylococcaceae bacterium]
RDMRIRQEILLGIGGVRALEALGIEPEVCHMNEGHTAFLALERIRRLMQREGLNFAEALAAARAGHVFTTHTPVPAGNDYFSPALVEHYFHAYWPQLGLERDSFLALGRRHADDSFEEFCMTVLALKLSNHNNAVSRLHESVSREMWAGLWPEAPRAELPISHVTNGVHAESWISHDLTHLLDNYLGPVWRSRTGDADAWEGVGRIPIEELWRTHERRRERLVAFSRHRLRQQLAHRGASLFEQSGADSILDPQALTIGFARRFATYKRPLLLLSDPARLTRLLNDPDRPVQIIFAGKAHPRDEAGKDMIRQIAHLSRQPQFHKNIVFLEDYDLDVARYMVQGVDVWLNNPRRPLEASGTSGMKAALNGVLNLSILDGWWDEAYEPEIGWAIGQGEQYEDEATQDSIESAALYDLLEKEIVPLFYERKSDRLPHYWVQRMRKAMRELCPRFNTCRMVSEYAKRFYLPAHQHYQHLTVTGFAPARRLADWSARVTRHWGGVRIEAVKASGGAEMHVGDLFTVEAQVRLGALTPEDVSVQLCVGTVNNQGDLVNPALIPMQAEKQDGTVWNYQTASQPCCHSGLHGYTVRMLPRHADLHNPWALGLAQWASS